MEVKDLGKRDLTPGELDNPAGDIDPKDPTLPADDPSANNKGNDGAGKKVYSESEKHLYARATSAEAELKIYKDKYGEGKIDPNKDQPKTDPTPNPTDPFSLAKVVASLKEYDAEEIDFAATISKVKGIAPAEAVKTPDFTLWLKGKRDRDALDNKVPAPGGAGSHDNLPSDEDVSKMSNAEHAKFEKDYLAKSRNKGSGL